MENARKRRVAAQDVVTEGEWRRERVRVRARERAKARARERAMGEGEKW
jgi:hypothetical protein